MTDVDNRTFADWVRRAQKVASLKDANFVELFRAAGLDPAKHARYADWSGIDFSGCDLGEFDFTGARLHGCRFDGAQFFPSLNRVLSQRPLTYFAQAELGQVIHRPGRDPHAPAEMTEVADLSRAERWEFFRRPIILRHMPSLVAPRVTSDSHLPTGAIFQDAPFGPQMIVIPAGEFLMGSPDGSGGDQSDVAEPERSDDEGPRRLVTISRRFALGRFAVTFDEYDAYAEATGVERPKDQGWGRGRQPVINVSAEDAEKYAKWLSEITGADYRLPSEAEWEYACRAGTDTPFWWGAKISTEQANYDGNQVYNGGIKGVDRGRTVPVGEFDANPWGLYQMHGNVWEWCADRWHKNYNGAPDDGRPWEDGEDASRVLRGGSWFIIPEYLRSAFRYWYRPGDRGDYIGFRLARTLHP